MEARIVSVTQGSPEWHDHRTKTFNASELARAMGIDPNGRKRTDLIKNRALGLEDEFSDYVRERVIEPGHEIEAAARAIIEARIGCSLYPVTLAGDLNGLQIGASLDGITADDSTTFECKRRNAELWDSVAAGVIPEGYHPQCEQGLLLSGAEVCLFTVSDGTDEGTIYCEYRSRPDLRARIEPTWRQVAEDVANYQHVEREAAPVGQHVGALPVPFVQVEGRVVASNMGEFKAAAAAFLARLPKALTTDQDFADAEKAVKACKDAEAKLAAVKDAAQAQATSIDEAFRALDEIKAQVRDARLALEKQVTREKENRRSNLMSEYLSALAEHLTKLEDRIGGAWMPRASAFPPIVDAIKGLKTLDSMRDKLGVWLANCKIRANETADQIERNIRRLEHAGQNSYLFLFPDFAQVCTKSDEDFGNLAQSRIRQHSERMEAEAEAERTRIRAEERAKAEEDQRGKAALTYTCDDPDTSHLRQNGGGQQSADADQREMPDTEAASTPTNTTPEGEPAMPAGAWPELARPAANEPEHAEDNGETMKLGDLSARLGFNVTAEFLASLGFHHIRQDKNANLYRKCDFLRICQAIANHVLSVAVISRRSPPSPRERHNRKEHHGQAH